MRFPRVGTVAKHGKGYRPSTDALGMALGDRWNLCWHPSRMRFVQNHGSGAVVAGLLKHRLIALNPPGSSVSRGPCGQFG